MKSEWVDCVFSGGMSIGCVFDLFCGWRLYLVNMGWIIVIIWNMWIIMGNFVFRGGGVGLLYGLKFYFFLLDCGVGYICNERGCLKLFYFEIVNNFKV